MDIKPVDLSLNELSLFIQLIKSGRVERTIRADLLDRLERERANRLGRSHIKIT